MTRMDVMKTIIGCLWYSNFVLTQHDCPVTAITLLDSK